MPKNTPERRIDNIYSRNGSGSVVVRAGNTTVITEPAHSHSDYLPIATHTTHVATADAHHARAHSIVSASDHTATGSQYQILGLTAANTVGLLTPASDVSAGNKIAISDVSGNLTATNLTANTQVSTPLIVAASNLVLTPTGNIHTESLQASASWVSGTTGAGVNWSTGVADFRSMTADELVVESFIAAVKKAHVGALIVTKSMSLTTREFTVPTPPATATLYVADIPGHGDMLAFDDGDDVAIPYMSTSESYAPTFQNTAWATDNGSGGVTVHYAEEDFEGYTAGDDPTDWRDTEASDSMTEDDTLFDVQSVGGTKAFGTTDGGSDIHTHYDGTGAQALDDYRVTGRVRMGGSSTAFGFTLFSQFESGGSADYYRIRRKSSKPTLQVDNIGDYDETMDGTTDSGYNPAAETWHQFKIEIEDDGTYTIIRAKFWADGGSEPASWQIDCQHDHANRGTSGTFGFWSRSASDGVYFDDIQVVAIAGGTSSVAIASISVKQDDVLIASIQCLTAATFTPHTGWTLITSQAYGSNTVYWYRHTATADGTAVPNWTASTGEITCEIIAIRDLDTADIIEASGTGTFSAVGSFEVAGLSPAASNAAYMIMAMHDGDSGNTPPSGMTRYGSEPDTGSISHTMFGQIVPSGATGVKTVGMSVESATGAYLQIALNSKTGTETGLSLGTAWGTVAAVVIGDEDEEQAYTFTLESGSPGAGQTVLPDSVVLDYGVTRDGYVEITTLDPNGAPYMQIATRGPIPRLDQTVQLRIGNLEGIAAVDAAATWGMYVQGAGGSMELSDAQMAMADIDSTWTTSGATFARINNTEGAVLTAGNAEDIRRSYSFDHATLGDMGGMYSAGLYDTEWEKFLSLRVLPGDYDSRITMVSSANDSYDSEILLWAVNGDAGPYINLLAQTDTVAVSSTNILLAGVTIASVRSPTFSDYADMVLIAVSDVGGWATFKKKDASARTYWTATGSVSHVIGQAVLTSGSSTTSLAVDCAVSGSATTGTFNSITVTIGVDANGRLYTQRATGSNTYSVQMHASWIE